MRTFWISTLAVALALLALPAAAQPVISAQSGTVSLVEGQVYLGDQLLEPSLTKFPDIKQGLVLRTAAGRAEVLLSPGVVMSVGENSSFRMISRRLVDARLELLTGSVVVNAVEIAKETNVTIVCKEATIALSKAGTYRLDAEPARLKVFAGLADVEIGGTRVSVSGGKMLTLSGQLASAEKFNKEDTDSLDHWARRRNELMALANVSAARSANSYGGYGMSGGGLWGWNPYFGMYTYIPGSGRFCHPFYGYCYWSPVTVSNLYYRPPVRAYDGGGFGGWTPSYPTMGSTSGGYSGTMSSGSSSVSSAPAAAASSGSSAASSAGSSSVGQGSGASGGRGR
jgi:hypothetical protein